MTYPTRPLVEPPVERLRNIEQSLTLKVWEARPLTVEEHVQFCADIRDRITQIREQLEA
jgi:hypothetical protein